MKQIIKVLAKKLDLNYNDIWKKLDLKNENNLTDLANLIGCYAIFKNEEDLNNFVDEKLTPKSQELIETKNKLANLEKEHDEFVSLIKQQNNELSKTVNSIIENCWNNLGIKRNFETVQNLNWDQIDFNNLEKSLLNFAQKQGYAIKNNDIIIQEEKNKFDTNAVNIGNGIITKN